MSIPSEDNMVKTLLELLPYSPYPSQMDTIKALCDFVEHRSHNDTFVLNGYAGTGKTSITGALVRALRRKKVPVVLLAPTGRAAKVFSAFAGTTAYTIHKKIFRGNSLDPSNNKFYLAPNQLKDALFIIDEASMIADSAPGEPALLDLLVRHVYSAPGCNAIFIGDTSQLPPVGQLSSPAMDMSRLRSLGLNPVEATLYEPARQHSQSGILFNANRIRGDMEREDRSLPRLASTGFRDVEVVSSRDLADYISTSWSRVGVEDTIIITRSNKRAYQYNMGVRTMVNFAEEELESGDRLIIAKNNYFWTKDVPGIDFLANGEPVNVEWMGVQMRKYGLRFAEVELTLAGEENVVTAVLMLDSLSAEGPQMSRAAMQELYKKVCGGENATISESFKAATTNPYLNALQAKYAYCVTCHKAQGGQWKHVYIDLGGIPPDAYKEKDFYRWLYTAITRASEKVFFINPGFKIE